MKYELPHILATKARSLALHPMARFGTVDEVAEAVIWFCSKRAGFTTGHILPVDGGFVVP